MNTAMVKGILIGGLVTVGITAGGMVGYQAYTQPKYAEVLAVKPVTETVKQAREECRDVAVQRKAPVKDENRIAGTVIGGVIGGALGSTIGGGRGQTVPPSPAQRPAATPATRCRRTCRTRTSKRTSNANARPFTTTSSVRSASTSPTA